MQARRDYARKFFEKREPVQRLCTNLSGRYGLDLKKVSFVASARHAYQVDRLAAVAVLFRIARSRNPSRRGSGVQSEVVARNRIGRFITDPRYQIAAI